MGKVMSLLIVARSALGFIIGVRNENMVDENIQYTVGYVPAYAGLTMRNPTYNRKLEHLKASHAEVVSSEKKLGVKYKYGSGYLYFYIACTESNTGLLCKVHVCKRK